MILIDTSVWIDLLGKRKKFDLEEEDLGRIATCSPIIQEILQGIRDDIAYARVKESLLAFPRYCDPVDSSIHLQAADLYRFARKKGFTIRSSADCLIAAIAIENGLVVWHEDRDFEALSQFTSLKTWQNARLTF